MDFGPNKDKREKIIEHVSFSKIACLLTQRECANSRPTTKQKRETTDGARVYV